MKQILIYAYTFSNFGDDLFIKVLCERYPDTRFILYAPRHYKQTFTERSNLSVIANDTLFQRGISFVARKWPKWRDQRGKSYDAVVYIGGSLFIQSANWKLELEKLEAMQLKDKPFYLLGANFGPYTDEAFYIQHRKQFASFTDICFRDTPSYDLFKDLPNVRMAADVIFTLRQPLKQGLTDNHTKTVAISVIKPSIRKYLIELDEAYYKKMGEIAAYFIKQGYHVQLLAFCVYEADHEAIEKIQKHIPEADAANITTHIYHYDLSNMITLIANATMIVASRFHAMILAWVFQKPVFPITYSKKMNHVMEDVGFSGAYAELEQVNHITPEKVFQSMETAPLDISHQRSNAEKQFEKLDVYLRK